jgi:hypothetical protein
VGQRIEIARGQNAKESKGRTMIVPDSVIDGCKASHTAANEGRQKSDTDFFDDTGLMALTCRHGIPLLLANIDTPGEQQMYVIALLEVLFQQIPVNATCYVLYDVGCTLDRSLQIVCPDHL